MTRVNLGRDSSGRPLIVDQSTLDKLDAAEARLPVKALTITQGSYSNAAASAGTHTGGGVIDLRTWDLPGDVTVWRVLAMLRMCGLIAWHRTKAQGFSEAHIHAIDRGNPNLSPEAREQVRDWSRG